MEVSRHGGAGVAPAVEIWKNSEKMIDRKKNHLQFLLQLKTMSMLEPEHERLITRKLEENNGLLCRVDYFRICPPGQQYVTKYKFHVGIHERTKMPAVGTEAVAGLVKDMPDLTGIYPPHIIKAAQVLEKAVKASKFAPRMFQESVQNKVWREVMMYTNATEELMLLVFLNNKASATDLKTFKEELIEFYQNGEGKNNCNSLYVKVYNSKHKKGWDLELELLIGNLFLEETVMDIKFHMVPFLRFPNNVFATTAMFKGAEELLSIKEKTSVLMISSNVGVLGLHMSKIAEEVLFISTDRYIKEARNNAELNNIKNCKFFAGRYDDIISNAIKNITCSSCVAIIAVNSNFFDCNKMIKYLREIKSLNRILLIMELNITSDKDIVSPLICSKDCYPFIPARAIPVDMPTSVNLYTVMILLEHIDLVRMSLNKSGSEANALPSLLELSFNDRNPDPSSANQLDRNSGIAGVSGEGIRQVLALEQRKLMEDEKILLGIQQQQRQFEEELKRRRRLEEEQQRRLLNEEQHKRTVVIERERRRLEEELHTLQFEGERRRRNIWREQERVLFEEEFRRRVWHLDNQRRLLEEESEQILSEADQQRRRFEVEQQRILVIEEEKMRQFVDELQRQQLVIEQRRKLIKDLYEKQQIVQVEEERRRMAEKLRIEQQRSQLEEEQRRRLAEEFHIRQLQEEEWWRKQLEEEEIWRRRRKLEGEEWQRRMLEIWHRRQLGGEWQRDSRNSEEWQLRMLEVQGHRFQLEDQQRMYVEEQHRRMQLEEERRRRQFEEEQWRRRLEEQHRRQFEDVQRRLQLEDEKQKKQVVDGQQRKQLENQRSKQFKEEWRKAQLEEKEKNRVEEEQKKQLEEETQKKQLEEEEKKKLKEQLEKSNNEGQKKELNEETTKKQLEEKERKKKLEEEENKKKLEEEEHKMKLEKGEQKKKLEDEERKKKLEEERCKKKLEEEEHKKQLKEEELKKQLEQERQKKLIEEARQRRQLEEAEEKKKLEGERLKQQLEEERRKLQLEEEKQKKEIEMERKRIRLEEEQKMKRLKEMEKKLEMEKRKLEEDRKRIKLEEEQDKKRLAEVRERRRLEEEQERRKLEEEWEKRRLEEQERRWLEDEQNRRRLEEEWERRWMDEKRKREELEERESKRLRSGDNIVRDVVSDSLKEIGVTELSPDVAVKLKRVIAEAIKSTGVVSQQPYIGSTNITGFKRQELLSNQQSGAITSNTYVRYEHLANPPRRDISDKFSRNEWQQSPSEAQNRTTSNVEQYKSDWNNRGLVSQQYPPDWNNKGLGSQQYPANVSSKSPGNNASNQRLSLDTTVNRYSFKDTFNQLSSTRKATGDGNRSSMNNTYGSGSLLSNIALRRNVADSYNRGSNIETPMSGMGQSMSGSNRADSYRLDSASFHSWKDDPPKHPTASSSDSEPNPFRSYWEWKRGQNNPERQ